MPVQPPADLPDPVLSENAHRVLKKRYLKKDQEGRVIESVRDMCWRVASTIAANEWRYQPDCDAVAVAREFYTSIVNLDFLPNSPTLMNAGRELGQLSACFVLPIEDSMEGIFDAIKNAAIVHKSGGGTGFSFSRIRPKASRVASTAGTASGPISFMNVFNSATETIKQGGTRRGANMGILRVDHPDIRDFIVCKADMVSITNFNISVAATDTFMQAVVDNKTYDLIDPRTKQIVRQENAREIFNLITENTWNNGDPGLIFIDEINRHEKTPHLGPVESTNPCGEQPLLPYESCNLGSINLDNMLTEAREIDWEHLRNAVRLAVRFLDNIVDLNKYPIPQIEEMTLSNRRIGLGIMGFADLLYALNIPYSSDEGVEMGRNIMRFIHTEARKTSDELAEERGAFPNCEQSVHNHPTRNSTVTTIAPTGTISMIAETSGGIEPNFAICYVKRVMDDERLLYVNRRFEEAARNGGWYSPELMDQLADGTPLANLKEVPAEAKKVFATAHDIAPEWHINMQAAFQEWTENAVSKTINLSEQATVEDVKDVYLTAWQKKCKGITIYRDGSRKNQVLTVGNKLAQDESAPTSGTNKNEFVIISDPVEPANVSTKRRGSLTPRKRPRVTRGYTEQIETGQGTLFVTINEDEQGLCEVFASIGRSGGNAAAQSEAIGRLISLAARSGISTHAIVKQLKGITGANPVWHHGELIRSTPDAIGRALERYLAQKEKLQVELDLEASVDHDEDAPKPKQKKIAAGVKTKPVTKDLFSGHFSREQCPECQGTFMVYQEGCMVCTGCGYSKCD